MPSVTKKDIVSRMSDKMGITQQEASDALETVLESIATALAQGEDVTFRTFGTFELRVSKGKLGRNPNKPEVAVRIPDRYVVRFKPGRELKDQISALPVRP